LVAKISDWNVYYYHYDGIGSTVAMSDSSGNMVNKYSYDEFGNLINAEETITNPFLYVGQYGVMEEENGLLYMRARYYDPEVGRFINKDPIGFWGGINFYTYVQNNPVNNIDPDGEIVLPPGVGISIQRCILLAREIREEAQRKYPWTRDERYNHMRHCWTSCTLAQRGGNICSFLAGWYTELNRRGRRGYYDPEDVEANAKGRKCAASSDCETCCKECEP